MLVSSDEEGWWQVFADAVQPGCVESRMREAALGEGQGHHYQVRLGGIMSLHLAQTKKSWKLQILHILIKMTDVVVSAALQKQTLPGM